MSQSAHYILKICANKLSNKVRKMIKNVPIGIAIFQKIAILRSRSFTDDLRSAFADQIEKPRTISNSKINLNLKKWDVTQA